MVNRVMETGHSMWWKTRRRFKPGFPSMLPKGRPPLRTELMPFLVVFIQIDMAPVNHGDHGSISVSQPLSPCSPSTHHQHENHHWCPRCDHVTKHTKKSLHATEHTHTQKPSLQTGSNAKLCLRKGCVPEFIIWVAHVLQACYIYISQIWFNLQVYIQNVYADMHIIFIIM